MKRYLPLLSLIVVSVLVSLCALGVVFFLSVDAITLEEKVQSMLTLGVPSALVLVVLLWFGAGMDHALSRMKNRSTRVGVSLLTYILVPVVLCVGLPALAAFLIYGAFNAPRAGSSYLRRPRPSWRWLPPTSSRSSSVPGRRTISYAGSATRPSAGSLPRRLSNG